MEKKDIDLSQYTIPGKPILSASPRGTKVKLFSNFFNLTLQGDSKIYIYDVKFLQELPPNNTPFKRGIIRSIAPDLEKKFNVYFYSGSNIYSPTDAGDEHFMLVGIKGVLKYDIEFSRVGEISTLDLKGTDPAKRRKCLAFLNLVVKSLLSACNMFPIGRTGKYLISNGAKKIEGFPLEVWPGYYTSVNFLDAGLLLEVDYTSRVLRQESVYEYMTKKMKVEKTNVNDALKADLVGQVVLTRYGNKRTYRISDVEFSQNPTTHEFEVEEGKINMETYFRKKYYITLQDKTQPLLTVKRKMRDGTESTIYLPPEMCSLTGIPPELKDDRVAIRQMSVYTKLTPEQRMKEVEKLLNMFNKAVTNKASSTGSKSGNLLLNDWKVKIDPRPKEVEGRILNSQEILLSKDKKLKVNENGQFFFKEEICKPLAFDRWILVHTEKDKATAESLVNTMYRAAQTFGINVDFPIYCQAQGVRAKDYIDALTPTLAAKGNAQMVLFILPPPSTNEYGALKKFAITHSPAIFSQMIKSKTVGNPKNLMAVCSKLILQMNAKRNGELWKINAPKTIPRKTMVIGIDSVKEGHNSCIGVCSSFDPSFVHYHTQVSLVDPKEAGARIASMVVKGLEKFQSETKVFLPDLIVIYRDGLTESQRQNWFIQEIKLIEDGIKSRFPDYKFKMLYATLNKKVHTRFFSRTGPRGASGTFNPQPGTVIHSDIVDPTRYEFLLMPQYVNEGTGTPVRIQVLRDTSGIPVDVLEELTNSLCYSYFNWQGPIRCPAPCKYAFTHARLIARYTKTLPSDLLLQYLYFL